MSEYLVSSEDLELESLALQLSHGLTHKLRYLDEFATVAAMPVDYTVSEPTELDVVLTSNLSVVIKLNLVDTIAKIIWGDGYTTRSSSNSGDVSIIHTYGSAGEYTIKIVPESSNGTINLGISTHNILGLEYKDSKPGTEARLTAARIGLNASLNSTASQYAFFNCTQLRSLSVPQFAYSGSSALSTSNILKGCTNLKFIASNALASLSNPIEYCVIGPDASSSVNNSVKEVVICDRSVAFGSGFSIISDSIETLRFPRHMTSIGEVSGSAIKNIYIDLVDYIFIFQSHNVLANLQNIYSRASNIQFTVQVVPTDHEVTVYCPSKYTANYTSTFQDYSNVTIVGV